MECNKFCFVKLAFCRNRKMLIKIFINAIGSCFFFPNFPYGLKEIRFFKWKFKVHFVKNCHYIIPKSASSAIDLTNCQSCAPLF